MIRPMVILPPVIFMSLAVLFYLGLARSDPDALQLRTCKSRG
jgi:hypothetical protein